MMAPNSQSRAIIKRNSAKQLYQRKEKLDPELSQILKTSLDLATYYIPYHLRCCCKHELLKGLPQNYVVPPANPPELYLRVASFSYGMEKRFSSFFEQVPSHMNIKDENSKFVFISLCKRVVSSDINWGRVMTIFAVGGALAVHFVNKGKLDIVKLIPSWIAEVFETAEGLSQWIKEQGGWESLSLRSKDDVNNASWSPIVTTVGVVAAAGMLFLGLRK